MIAESNLAGMIATNPPPKSGETGKNMTDGLDQAHKIIVLCVLKSAVKENL